MNTISNLFDFVGSFYIFYHTVSRTYILFIFFSIIRRKGVKQIPAAEKAGAVLKPPKWY